MTLPYAYTTHPDDRPSPSDVADLEELARERHQQALWEQPRTVPCRTDLHPGDLCSTCWTDHSNTTPPEVDK